MYNLVREINSESGLGDEEFLEELEKLMIKYRVYKIDIGWRVDFLLK